jgi:hypothetical protein
MALAHLTINLDAFTGDDRPPVSQYSTITLDPGVDHIDAANDVIHVRSIVVSLDRQGKAATANGVPCVDGRVPVVAGVAYAVSAPNVLRGGPHYIPALTAAQVVDLSDYITPGAPLTPDQAATLTARIVALEAGGGGGGGGVTVHNLLTGRSTADAHPTSAITGLDAALTGKASTTHGHVIADTTGLQATLDAKAATSHTHTGVYAPALGADDNYVTGAEKAALHTHPAVIAQGATQADARTAIGAGTSSIVVGTGAGDAKAGNYQPTAANVSDSTTTGRALLTAADAAAARTTLALGTAATTASTAYATAAQGATADAALAAAAAPELIRDTMAAALVAGSNVTITPNDGADTITIAASGGGSGGGIVTADDTPAAPAEGESATYFVTSAVTWPVGLVWSTDPDGDVAPTITSTALVSMFTLDGVTRAIMGATFPVPPDAVAPSAPTGLSAVTASHTTVNLSWTASTDNVAVTGYEYRIGSGAAVDAGVGVTETVTGLSPSTAYTFQVRAYDATGNRSAWSTSEGATTSAAPADSTPPTVGTLAGSSITSSGFTLTVSGAADETALHATPYRFSTDNGATYSAYQSSAVYAATGLAASTGYTCKHQTRDAAGNTSTGAAVVVTTGVAATGLVATYTGNASNGTPTNPHTFTAAAIGTAAADRHVIVAATWSTAASVTNITGITVGGVAATIDATYYNATGPRGCTIARAAVPTGTTANVVVTMSGAVPSRLGVGTWAVTGAPSLALVDNDAAMFTDAAANSLTLDAVADGVVIAHAHGGAADHTWTNLTERYDVLVENGFSGADAATTTTSHTVTVQKAAATYTLQAVTYQGTP